MTDLALQRPVRPQTVRGLNLTAKAGLVLLIIAALAYPDSSHLRDKAAGLRAISYPLLAFAIPVVWFTFWRDRVVFPWLADLFVTLTCFSDFLGNRLDLYDTVVWFDDFMHFANTGLLAAAVLLLTTVPGSPLLPLLERALAFGVTAALVWEIAEFFAFMQLSDELPEAYADTLGDLTLGAFGAVAAALAVWYLRARPAPAPRA
jgi:hypothetical protein